MPCHGQRKTAKSWRGFSLRGGFTPPIRTWKQWIVDGFEQYELCVCAGLPYTVEQLPFTGREEAILWICTHNALREDLTEEQAPVFDWQAVSDGKSAPWRITKQQLRRVGKLLENLHTSGTGIRFHAYDHPTVWCVLPPPWTRLANTPRFCLNRSSRGKLSSPSPT